ncbi:MAG: hypothetical protein VX278_14980 [Myxococcota bacterium]|nr:hypothetical protein [Myxococcota bacterium]
MTALSQGLIQASVTKNIVLQPNHRLVSTEGFSYGTLLVGRVTRTSEQYGRIETIDGQMRKLKLNDVVVGALGNRAALRGHTGHMPEELHVGDTLSLLNLGGVIGEVSSSSHTVGEPVQLEILGAISDASSGILNVSQSLIEPSMFLSPLPPVIVVAGSCMHAGKTEATCTLIRYLSDQNFRCAALKLTGVGAQKDLKRMSDAGAIVTHSFVDAGLPSTCGVPSVSTAKGCLNYVLSQSPDMIVVELGDGLLGEYGVLSILNDPQIKSAVSAIVFSAADPVGAWGGSQILKQNGLLVDVVTGPCTDNLAGCKSIAEHCQSHAVNATHFPQRFGQSVLRAVFGPMHKKVGA